MSRASVFIGSSSEGREVARAIGEGLECCADTIMWDEDVFEFGRGYLEELMTELEKHDFAVLVLTPDDERLKRKIDAQLRALLDKGVRVLKNSAPNLAWLAHSSRNGSARNGSSRNGSSPSRKATAHATKAGKKRSAAGV